jgi:hypothetical protein
MIMVLANLTALTPLALGLVLCRLTPVAAAAEALEEASATPHSRFVRTALALQSATDAERTDFASVALSELAVTYQAEADLARHQSRELAGGNKLASWSAAVYGFVDQLVLVQEDIDLGFPVELRHLYGQVIGVVAGGRTVILSHPRADQQSVYELRVLTDFCARHDCPRLTAAAQGGEPEPIPVSAPGVSPHWDFRESGPLCSHRGISLHFTSTTQLTDRRGICQQLMVEAETLAAELAWQQRHGVDIDWADLSIQSTPRRPQHILTLNRAGDSILASVPVFYGTEGLLQQMVPWLKARYDGDGEYANIELDAAALGWE